MSATTIGILCGLRTMMGYGIMNGLSKQVLVALGIEKTIFWRSLLTIFIIGMLLLVFRNTLTWDRRRIGRWLLLGILWYIPYLSFMVGLHKGEVGLIAPVANSSLLTTTLFALLILHEIPSVQWWWGIVLILIWLVLLTMNFQAWRHSKLLSKESGVPYAIIANIGWWLVFVLFKQPSMILWAIMMTFLITIANTVCSAWVMYIQKISWRPPSLKFLGLLFLIGLLTSTATLTYNMGIIYADVYLVAALSSASPLIAFVYGYFVYRERLSQQQMMGILVILGGMLLIVSS